jgi:pimeloyl-ACP methyl ester carboxylesterase
MLLLGGCAFRQLRHDLTRFDEMALLGGEASAASDDGTPIVVVLYAGTPGAVVDSFVLDRPGAYFFSVPAGTYRIAAFVDRNRDLVYQPGVDPVGYYGAPTNVPVGAGQQIRGLDVRIGTRSAAPLGFPVSVRDVGSRGTPKLPAIHVGEIVSIDDPRFSAENGHLGLWQPVEFLFAVGAGFYFLEPYDPKKTPVLFVHGAGGYPSQFRYLIAHMDRKKFQPWLLYYPSGLDIDVTARGIARWMNALAARYDFAHIAVVAHSMGGLVSRATINHMTADADGGLLDLFVTISTPWNGVASAQLGLEQAPVIMPMWRNIAPGSAFLDALFETPLPAGCPYNLLFSYNGDSLFVDKPNDGVVAISSELALRAQRLAKKVYGFDRSHTGILEDPDVSETVNGMLADAVR